MLENMAKDLVKVIALLNPIEMRDVSFPSLTTCSAARLMATHTVFRFFPRDLPDNFIIADNSPAS